MPDETITPDTTTTPAPEGESATTTPPEGEAPTDETSKDEPINPDDYEIEERTKPEAQKEEGEEDDGIDPEDKARISKVVDKRLSPIEQRIQKQADEIEVNDYILNNPEMSKYKPVILKYMASDAYKNVPVKGIAAIVSASDMQKIGAQKEREAQRKVSSTQNGGTPARSSAPTKFDASTASFADMEKEIARVKGQQT